MKTLLLFVLVTALSISAGFGRIGETPAECIDRYGAPVDEEDSQISFLKGEMMVIAYFHAGKCDMLVFSKLDRSSGRTEYAELSAAEIEVLLQANGSGQAWEETSRPFSPDRAWETEGGAIVAQYAAISKMLVISTQENREREKAEKAAEQKKGLEGF